MSTRLFAVQGALSTMFDAALSAPVVVFLGPRPRSGSAPRQFVLVGADGGDTGLNDGLTDDGLTADQAPSDLGNDWLDETGVVRCSAWAWHGDAEFASLRTQVQSLFDACAATVRADRTLGGVLDRARPARMSGIAIRETPTVNGPYVRAGFTVAYSALITT